MDLGVPVRVELAFVVVGSPNAGVGLVGMMLGVPIRIGWSSLLCALPMLILDLPSPLCIVLGDPVRGGLACVVQGSPNAGGGIVGVVLGVPIRTEVAVVVMGSRNANTGPSSFSLWVPVRGGLQTLALG